MANALHDLARGARGQIAQCRIARCAVADPSRDLDQLMIREGPIQFLDDAVGESGIAQHDDGTHGMRQPAQMFFLFLGQCHGAIIVGS